MTKVRAEGDEASSLVSFGTGLPRNTTQHNTTHGSNAMRAVLTLTSQRYLSDSRCKASYAASFHQAHEMMSPATCASSRATVASTCSTTVLYFYNDPAVLFLYTKRQVRIRLVQVLSSKLRVQHVCGCVVPPYPVP